MMELWPFTNFHDLNLDWIIKKIRNVEDSEAAAKASEEAAADSANAASASMGMALLYRNKAKDYRDEAQGFANDAAAEVESIEGVVDQVNSNTSRISELIAHAGDGTIPSELTDIRVAYNGVTYTTAGDAVRAQAEDCMDALENFENAFIDISQLKVLNAFDKDDVTTGGFWNLTDGVTIYPNTSYVACNKYVFIKPSTDYSAWYKNTARNLAPSLYTPISFYDENHNFISSIQNTDTNIYTSPNNARYMRVSGDASRLDSLVVCEGTVYNGYQSFGYEIGDNTSLVSKTEYEYLYNALIDGSINSGDVTDTPDYFTLPDIQKLPDDVTITLEAGWEMHVFYYIDNVQTNAHSGWYVSTHTVPAGTPFNFYMHKVSGTGTLDEARAALKFEGFNIQEFDRKGVYTHYYYEGEAINLKRHKVNSELKAILNFDSLPSGGLQAADLYNDVLCICRGDDYIYLYDYTDGSFITSISAPVGHGNAFQFGKTFNNSGDEFPVAYASPFFSNNQDTYSYVNKITFNRTSGTLLRKYRFDVSTAGYYAEGCANDDESIMYTVGYKESSYTDGTDNAMIVCCWDMNDLTNNNDGTVTPALIKTFTVRYESMLQGVKWIDSKILVTVAPEDGNSNFNSYMFAIDPGAETIVSTFKTLPITAQTRELEDTYLVPDVDGYKLGLLNANGYVHELIL